MRRVRWLFRWLPYLQAYSVRRIDHWRWVVVVMDFSADIDGGEFTYCIKQSRLRWMMDDGYSERLTKGMAYSLSLILHNAMKLYLNR